MQRKEHNHTQSKPELIFGDIAVLMLWLLSPHAQVQNGFPLLCVGALAFFLPQPVQTKEELRWPQNPLLAR